MREYELTPPKTEGSIRSIEIEPEITQLIRSHYRRQMKLNMKYRHEVEHDANFVFCRANGYDLTTIMERVGHDDPQTTLKIYTHVTKKMKKDASAKIKNLYENALSKFCEILVRFSGLLTTYDPHNH